MLIPQGSDCVFEAQHVIQNGMAPYEEICRRDLKGVIANHWHPPRCGSSPPAPFPTRIQGHTVPAITGGRSLRRCAHAR